MKNKLLPLGSIVTTGKDNTLIMIDGYGMQNHNDGKLYDYSGVVYPLGINPNELKLFNKEDIRDLVFVGYQNKGFDMYSKAIEKFIKDVREGKSIESAAIELAKNVSRKDEPWKHN